MNQKKDCLKVQEIGEQGLLKRLQSFCPAELVGDDAAILVVQLGRSLVVTADVLVDGVHFSDRTTTPADAGWRAAAANLSDLAAMGAIPLGITIGLALPGEVTVDWVEQLYQGVAACLQQYNTSIVGGDVCRSPVATVAITAFGEVDPTRIIRRSTAQPGDAILVTGVHGASRSGLELLLHPDSGQALNSSDRAALIRAHQRPKPRLDVVTLLLNSSFTPPQSRFIAGMDSSDGLADAIVQICHASGVGARVERSQISMPPVLTGWIGPDQALNWALYGGEDFELVLCLPVNEAQELLQQLNEGAAIIGTITQGSDIWLVDTAGEYPDQRLTLEQGFQHFDSNDSGGKID
jgi:thiamine-monophosphate kinase